MNGYLAAMRNAWNLFRGLPNVIGVGLGPKEVADSRTDKMATVVFVTRKVRKNKLRSREIIPETLGEMPTDVIEVGEIELLDAEDRKVRLRPARPGMSIGHQKVTAGTFGAVVKDIETGEPLILSNNHVLANATDGEDNRAAVGDPICQPGPYDGGGEDDVIGHLLRFVPLKSEYLMTSCPVAMSASRIGNMALTLVKPDYRLQFLKINDEPNYVDGAVARPISPDAISSDIIDIGPVAGISEPAFTDRLKKSGRTSGTTSGQVAAIAATLRIQVRPGYFAVFADQIVTTVKSSGGDSGSLMVNADNEAVGLLFAGSPMVTVANRIENVMNSLKISF